MKFQGYAREFTEEKMRRANQELKNGRSIPEVCEAIGVEEDVFRGWALTLFRMAQQLSNSPLLASVCPVFWAANGSGRLQQIGTAVLIRLVDDIFLLTAAHVTDEMDKGDLYIPAREQFLPISGHVFRNQAPALGNRENDRIDMAYYRLSPELARELHSELKPLSPSDVDPLERPQEGDWYTCAGYPWRKSVATRGLQQTELVTFSGYRVADAIYDHLGYSRTSSVVIQFRRNKAFSSLYKSITPSPLPHGISGGAIFSWPKEVENTPDVPNLKLVGICHTYHKAQHLISGTHIAPYLFWIQRNHPEIPLFPSEFMNG